MQRSNGQKNYQTMAKSGKRIIIKPKANGFFLNELLRGVSEAPAWFDVAWGLTAKPGEIAGGFTVKTGEIAGAFDGTRVVVLDGSSS